MSSCITSGAKDILTKVLDRLQNKFPDKMAELEPILKELRDMPLCAEPGAERSDRPISRWQMCLKQELKGKPLDPANVRAASVKYKAGKCPC